MGIEIDFLAVGDESKSGDAVAIRYGNLFGPRDQHRVVVIDGGFTDNGTALVELIRGHYQTDQDVRGDEPMGRIRPSLGSQLGAEPMPSGSSAPMLLTFTPGCLQWRTPESLAIAGF